MDGSSISDSDDNFIYGDDDDSDEVQLMDKNSSKSSPSSPSRDDNDSINEGDPMNNYENPEQVYGPLDTGENEMEGYQIALERTD
jgi:hypothetical protein